MGAWDSGPFDNDDAMDLIGDIVNAKPDTREVAKVLSRVMTFVLESTEYIEAPDMAAAIAAACIVAVRVDPSVSYGSLSLMEKEELDRVAFDVKEEGLKDLAKRVFVRAHDPENNEWYDLWKESDGLVKSFEKQEAFQRVLES